MKQKRSLMAVILVIILLTFAVSGTIAYLKTNTGTVTNTFTPTKVDTEIVEGFTNNNTEKAVIQVVNPTAVDAIPAYVRVAVVGNWYDAEGKIVSPWSLPESSLNKLAWTKIGDYYYHNNPVAVGGYTANLLGNGATIAKTDTNHPNLHLEVTVMQQAIQAEPASAVAEAWTTVTRTSDGWTAKSGS